MGAFGTSAASTMRTFTGSRAPSSALRPVSDCLRNSCCKHGTLVVNPGFDLTVICRELTELLSFSLLSFDFREQEGFRSTAA